MGRQIKKTVIKYQTQNQQQKKTKQQQRERSRQKQYLQKTKNENQQIEKPKLIEQVVDVNSRKARLEALKKAKLLRQEQEKRSFSIVKNQEDKSIQMPQIVVVSQNNFKIIQNLNPKNKDTSIKEQIQRNELKQKEVEKNKIKLQQQSQSKKISKQQSSQEEQVPEEKILLKPVFISKQNRNQLDQEMQMKQKQEQRKKKNIKYTTKLLLQEDKKNTINQEQEQQQDINNQDQDNQTNLPDDDDNKNQQLQYQLWKIRELKRIRQEKQDRQKHIIQKAEIQRRRNMDNTQILIENRLLGSDSTSNQAQTKYVFMQKYYHKGAFYQDSQDPIFKRDYNLPTPMEMQDKSSLPQVLQKRIGNFGKRGQSKYTHLNAQDTTDTNPLTRPDQSLLNGWKKKMAGYKN